MATVRSVSYHVEYRQSANGKAFTGDWHPHVKFGTVIEARTWLREFARDASPSEGVSTEWRVVCVIERAHVLRLGTAA